MGQTGPAHSGIIQRVLAIPNQRQRRALVGFLTRPEIEALLAAPNRTTWLGRRDHAFLLTAVQTGVRLSEMTSLRHEDVSLGAGALSTAGAKGERNVVPLWPNPRSQSSERGFGSKTEKIPKRCFPASAADV